MMRRRREPASKSVWAGPFATRPGLAQALAHRSWCAEHPDEPSNERLEFLGDAVLGIIVTDYVFRTYPLLQEGQLAKVRASVVNAEVLADVAAGVELGPCLRLGKGEDASGRPGEDVDPRRRDGGDHRGGLPRRRDGRRPRRGHGVVRRAHRRRGERPGGDDYKTRLQELAAQRFDKLPRYQVHDEGPDHAKRFFATVLLGGEPHGSGEGGSKKQAEQAAARAAWRWLSTQGEGAEGEPGEGEGAPTDGTTAGSAMGGSNAGAT